MKHFARLLLKLCGWKIVGEYPSHIKKSITTFAPHTDYSDGFFGKLFMMTTGTYYKFVTRKEFFTFPMNYFYRWFGSIPVERNREYVDYIAEYMAKYDSIHILISPEGQLARTARWKKGYYYMAKAADVPIIVGYVDYKRKELGVKGVITDLSDFEQVRLQLNAFYSDVTGRFPELFALDERKNSSNV